VEIRIRTRGFLGNDSQSRLLASAFSRLHDISITHLDVIGLVGLWDAFRLRKRQINRVTILSERPLKHTSGCEEYERPRVPGNTCTSTTRSVESRLFSTDKLAKQRLQPRKNVSQMSTSRRYAGPANPQQPQHHYCAPR
jgi:hypothetical protein